MDVILFRHGIAQDQAAGLADADRRLTDEGVRKTQRAAMGLARLINPPEALLTSPKLRAAETAQILGSVFDVTPQKLDVLTDGGADSILHSVLERPEGSIMLVGHEPYLSELAALMCGDDQGAARINLRKAGAAMIEIDSDGSGELQWLLTPRQLRRLGK